MTEKIIIAVPIWVSGENGEKCVEGCVGDCGVTVYRLEMCEMFLDDDGCYTPLIDGNRCPACLDAEEKYKRNMVNGGSR